MHPNWTNPAFWKNVARLIEVEDRSNAKRKESK
jgi:hypothetical protein